MQTSITEEGLLPHIDIKANNRQSLSQIKQNLLCWRVQSEQLATQWQSSGNPQDLQAWARLVCAMPVRAFHE